jgi:hypothetical protein
MDDHSAPTHCSLAFLLLAATCLFVSVGCPVATSAQDWRDDFQGQLNILSSKAFCDARVPGFAERTRDAYAEWRKHYDAELRALDQHPEVAQLVEYMSQWGKAEAAKGRADGVEGRCNELAVLLALRPRVEPSDPHLATPETTWAYFLQALRAADRPAAQGCLVGRALEEFGPTVLQLADDELRKIAESFDSTLRITARSGDSQEAVVGLKKGASGFIMFQLVSGNWRISQL